MNVQEMHIGLGIGMDKIASLSHDSLEPQEKDYYLNRAIDEYVKQQYIILRQEEELEEAKFVLENLRTLIVEGNINLFDPGFFNMTNSKKGTLPSDYSFYVFSKTIFDSYSRNNTLMTVSSIKQYLDTKSNKPVFRDLPVLIKGNEIGIVYSRDDQDAQFINLTYIKSPRYVNIVGTVSTDLPAHTHRDIVNMAVDFVLEDIKVLRPERQPQRQQ